MKMYLFPEIYRFNWADFPRRPAPASQVSGFFVGTVLTIVGESCDARSFDVSVFYWGRVSGV